MQARDFVSFVCCVFQLANGCSAHSWLVKINFFDAKTTFSVTNGANERKKERKATQKHAKHAIKKGSTSV